MSETNKGLARDFYGAVDRTAASWRRQLSREVYQRSNGTVAAGLFEGMKILPEVVWGDGDLAAKLVGCYEEELRPVLTKATETERDLIVNVGCAEGYYAVGLARFCPRARVVAFDINEAAQRVCRKTAELNGVADRVEACGECGHGQLRDLLRTSSKPLLVLDCEGAERDLLDPTAVDELYRCDIIVECHDFVDRNITRLISERFSSSHEVETIRQGARDPHASDLLRGFTELNSWLVVWEHRPETMHWLAIWRK